MAHSLSNGISTESLDDEGEEFRFSSELSLESVRAAQHQFCRDRDWRQYHPPRNVLLAMVGEVGELAELFQWRSEVSRGLPEFSASDKTRVGEELSDVLIYLIDLAEQCHVDLPSAVLDKMAKNAAKYPAERVRGRSDKYSDYPEYRPQEGQQKKEAGEEGERERGGGGGGGEAAVVSRVGREREEGDGSE
ncbi:hypothetical protein Pmani_000278 [Petrolisthes manimaculis]|uniref:Uncharacterized protein n=1 Tax=Petrolisthes manimaculis TaxID=1843537 RepID=A0AAE1QQG2_9EUCA|nr:hypothetical protein Pmani_000278 [Petrolisthes manimaculis]